MKIWSKKIWLVVGLLMTLGFVAVICWSATTRVAPQIITLSNGMQYRFAGADWGTNHSRPRLLSRVVDHLPVKWANFIRAKAGVRMGLAAPIFTQPALGIWLEPVNTNNALTNLRFIQITANLADEHGVRAGTFGTSLLSGPSPPDWMFLQFPLVPHHSRLLECVIKQGPMTGQFQQSQVGKELGTLKFANPVFGHFPQWQPEPLPATKSAGDLHVQLNGLSTRTTSGGGCDFGYTVCSLIFNSDRGTNETWAIAKVDLSDATGNLISQDFANPEGQNGYSIQGTLWPDEAVVRLKLGLKRTSAYPQTDLVMFTNLPVLRSPSLFGSNSTNGTSLTNLINRKPVELRNFITQAMGWDGPAPGPYWLEVKMPDRPIGTSVDIVEVVTDTGETITKSASSWSQTWRNYRDMPANAKFLNVTVAVQQQRFVEFMVKPPK